MAAADAKLIRGDKNTSLKVGMCFSQKRQSNTGSNKCEASTNTLNDFLSSSVYGIVEYETKLNLLGS